MVRAFVGDSTMIRFFNSPGSFRGGHYTDVVAEVETDRDSLPPRRTTGIE